MRTTILLCLILGFAIVEAESGPPNYWFEFGKFVIKYAKKYLLEEVHIMFAKFQKNLDLIHTHNSKGLPYKLALNQYADLSFEEFREKVLLKNPPMREPAPSQHLVSNTLRPKSVDWREKGVVTPIKDQGTCGSCWAFATAGTVESALAIKNGTLYSLSEQLLVDCSRDFGTVGCKGGYMDDAYRFLMNETFGEETEANYPYKAYDQRCRFNSSLVVTGVKNYTDIPSGNEEALMDAIATKGPVAVGFDVEFDFQFYSEGVYTTVQCLNTKDRLNHAMIAVGYGVANGTEYFLVKNSWGETWGEKGYIRVSIGRNLCGIATMASYPLL